MSDQPYLPENCVIYPETQFIPYYGYVYNAFQGRDKLFRVIHSTYFSFLPKELRIELLKYRGHFHPKWKLSTNIGVCTWIIISKYAVNNGFPLHCYSINIWNEFDIDKENIRSFYEKVLHRQPLDEDLIIYANRNHEKVKKLGYDPDKDVIIHRKWKWTSGLHAEKKGKIVDEWFVVTVTIELLEILRKLVE